MGRNQNIADEDKSEKSPLRGRRTERVRLGGRVEVSALAGGRRSKIRRGELAVARCVAASNIISISGSSFSENFAPATLGDS
jgi:hypothetical protein